MLSLIYVLATAIASGHAQSPELTIETTVGNVTGIINGTTPSVRQFLSIPYAQPPVNDLRFLPPQPISANASSTVDATQYPPSCPQFVSRLPSIYNQYATAWLPSQDGQSTTAGASLDTSSEDCLYLAIWTPANASNTSSLPVLFFMTGGAFQTGGVDIPVQIPSYWVEQTQSHIVVTINYRVNIFGFPNSPALSDQNVGILDQRAALEWTRDNIAAFGGDPSRITLWGQSAGAVSVDIHNFAYYSDPIASTMFAQSGYALLASTIGSNDVSQTNFTFVANSVGCNSTSDNDTEILECMQSLPAETITNALGSYSDNRTLTDPALLFGPIVDDKIVFPNYTALYLNGSYSNLPMIYSYTTQEGIPFVPYPQNTSLIPTSEDINTTLADLLTAQAFICPFPTIATLRSQNNASVPTYRSAFAGNFSNISPLPWMGAFHATDLAMYFGTYRILTNPFTGEGSDDVEGERETSEIMQDLLLRFASSVGAEGWTPYVPGGNGTIVEFGAAAAAAGDEVVRVQNITAADSERLCASLPPFGS